jgi:hypothetical protein
MDLAYSLTESERRVNENTQRKILNIEEERKII